jgi:uncharacterized sulfatase
LAGSAWAETGRSNVLLIIGDDQAGQTSASRVTRWSGRSHLDRLASQGVVFPNAYVTSPLCRPSLISIITAARV